jgi:hypothetical protein
MPIAAWILYPFQDLVMFSMLMLGYLVLNQAIFGRTILLTAFVQIFNFVLKSLFQIPLPAALHAQTFAFPSGHMHFYLAVFGWLAWEYQNRLFQIIVILYGLAFGAALIAMGYHDLDAVVASWLLVGCEFIGYYYLCRAIPYSKLPLLGLVIALICTIMLLETPHIFPMYWLWQMVIILLGFCIGWYLEQRRQYHKRAHHLAYSKATRCLLYLSSMGIIHVLLHLSQPWTHRLWFQDLAYFILCAWIGGGIPYTSDALLKVLASKRKRS